MKNIIERFKSLNTNRKILVGVIVISVFVIFSNVGGKMYNSVIDDELKSEVVIVTKTNKDKDEKPKAKKKEEPKELEITEMQQSDILTLNMSVLDKYDGLVLNVVNSDDYELVDIVLDENIYNLFEDAEKQIIIDEIGNMVENSTRATIFARPSKEFIHVYFKNESGEMIVKTKNLDRGWEIK